MSIYRQTPIDLSGISTYRLAARTSKVSIKDFGRALTDVEARSASALIDSLPDEQSSAADHPTPADDRSLRRLADGREFTIVKVYYTPTEMADALRRAGFRDATVSTTGRFFLTGAAIAD